MSDYTIVSLKEVEDFAPKFGHSPGMEARFASRPLELEQAGLGYFRLSPGYRPPFGHRHERQEEVFLVVSGSMNIKLDDEIVEVKAFDAIRIAPHVVRCAEGGPNGAEIVIFGAPKVDGDTEMLADWWTD
jgi:mannose-6-phosphate isomerase-like protein (cupin superfamily)